MPAVSLGIVSAENSRRREAAAAAQRAAAAAPPPLTSEEARQQSQAEGLTLLRVAQNKTGYFGVSLLSQPGKLKPFQAQLKRGGKVVYLGHFATAEEAALCVARSPEGQVAARRAASAESRGELPAVPSGAIPREKGTAGASSTSGEAAGEQRQRMEAALQAARPRPASPREEVQRLAVQEQRQLEAREELALQAVRAHVTARKPPPPPGPPPPPPQSSSSVIQCCTVTRRDNHVQFPGVQVHAYTCKFPGCGREFSARDAVRKHCRNRHLEWLRSIDRGPWADNAATLSSDELTSEVSQEKRGEILITSNSGYWAPPSATFPAMAPGAEPVVKVEALLLLLENDDDLDLDECIGRHGPNSARLVNEEEGPGDQPKRQRKK